MCAQEQQTFDAYEVTEINGRFRGAVTQKRVADLPDGDVLVRVHFSSLNYKDALSAAGNKGVTRRYPHTPGIDAAGVVTESASAQFQPGDQVIVTGFDLGMNTPGGFGQYIRVPADWVIALPAGLSLRESMIYGTAGFTAGQCMMKLLQHPLKADDGPIVVTGASGGVGSMAVALLAAQKFEVFGVTGKKEFAPFLQELGAAKTMHRDEFLNTSKLALLPSKWAGGVDTVGGDYLATLLRSTRHNGAVSCCGNVGGADLSITVYPFILRGISLYGIDSAATSREVRREIWNRLAGEWRLPMLDQMFEVVSLDGLTEKIEAIRQGKIHGRVVLRHAVDG